MFSNERQQYSAINTTEKCNDMQRNPVLVDNNFLSVWTTINCLLIWQIHVILLKL